MRRSVVCLCLCVWLAVIGEGRASGGREARPDIDTVVERMDRLYRSKTSYARIEMHIVTPHWERTMEMRVWTKGMDRTLISITAPKKDAGTATLRKGTEMWNYFPKINKVMKVPPSMMMGSWMGSDFTNDDLVKESTLTRDYHAAFGESESDSTYTVELTPKKQTATVWGKVVIRVRRDDLIPLQEAYYDEKGHRMRMLTFRDVRAFGGRQVPAVLDMRPLNKAGHRTVLRYLEARFNLPLDDEIFSLRNLRKRR